MLKSIRISNIVLALATLLICGKLAGCSRPKPIQVDGEQAREALKTTLDAWKNKQSQESVRSDSNITVQDLDWEKGWRLISYQIKGNGKEQDAQLRCPVELVLQDPKGTEVRKAVHYLITTSPQVTVFREVFPQ